MFDWCKEGNVKRMDVLLNKGENINAKDEQVSNFDCFKITFLSCKLSGSFADRVTGTHHA